LGSPEPRLPQYRSVQRRMAVALQAVDRRETDYADRDQGRAKELDLLGGDRSPDAKPRALLPEDHRAAQHERCSRRRQVPDHECSAAPARQGGVRRTLRALPFQQAARAGSRSRSSWLRRTWLFGLLEQVLELDEDRRVQT